MGTKILVIDDDANIYELLHLNLGNEGYDVKVSEVHGMSQR